MTDHQTAHKHDEAQARLSTERLFCFHWEKSGQHFIHRCGTWLLWRWCFILVQWCYQLSQPSQEETILITSMMISPTIYTSHFKLSKNYCCCSLCSPQNGQLMSRIEYEESMTFYTFLVFSTRKVYQYLKCQEVYQSSRSVLSYKYISIWKKYINILQVTSMSVFYHMWKKYINFLQVTSISIFKTSISKQVYRYSRSVYQVHQYFKEVYQYL